MFAATQQAAAQASQKAATGMDLLAQRAESEAMEQGESAGMKRKFVGSSNPSYQAESADAVAVEERESKLARNSEEIEI